MYKDPRQFFVQSVCADYKAYTDMQAKKETGLNEDVRAAAHAANSLNHMADHVFHTFKGVKNFNFTRLSHYQEHLKTICPDYALLKDCSNANKHRVSNRKNAKVRTAQDISEMVRVTEYRDELGPYRVATKEVQIKLSNGKVRMMSDVLKNVLNMWFLELDRLGIKFPNAQTSKIAAEKPKRENANGAAKLDLKIQL